MIDRWLPQMDPASNTPEEKEIIADAAPSAGPKNDGATPADAGLVLGSVEPLRVGKPDLWKKLIGIYLETTPASLEALEQALTNDDCPSVQMTAHILKSSSANLGAAKLADLFRQLEAVAEEGNLATGPVLFAEIRDEFDLVSAALAGEGESDALAERTSA